MRDTKKPVRIAVFTCLSGNIVHNGSTINFYDEKKKVGVTDTVFGILGRQRETPWEERPQDAFIRRSFIDIEIIAKTGSEASKDVIDEIGELVTLRLFPSPTTTNIIEPSLMQFGEWIVESAETDNISITETETILINRITLSTIVTQQYV